MRIHYCLIACAILFGSGCAFQDARPPKIPAFFEEELRSLNWKNPKGQTVALVSWDNISATADEDLVIAKYGDRNTGVIQCLDFFRVMPKEYPRERDIFVLLYHDWGPRDGNWRDTEVVSIKPEKLPNGVRFRIIRKILPVSGNSTNGVLYCLEYNLKSDYTMRLNDEEFFVNLSSQNIISSP
jgi:hypothetical protein